MWEFEILVRRLVVRFISLGIERVHCVWMEVRYSSAKLERKGKGLGRYFKL
jgi:hypothetical protein